MNIRFGLALLLTAAPAWAGFTFNQTEVDVFANLSPDGRRVEHPDAAHPVFYMPVMSQFMTEGGTRDTAHLSENEIARRVAVALSRQGYFLAHPGLRVNAKNEVTYSDGTVVTVPKYPDVNRPIALNQPGDDPLTVAMIQSASGLYSFRIGDRVGRRHLLSPILQVLRTIHPVHGAVMQAMPSIAVAIQYGVMGGTYGDLGGMTAANIPDFNLGPMIALIAGDSLKVGAFDLRFEEVDDIIQRTKIDRYFVIVTAFDFRSCLPGHKKVLLWRTRMSLPSTSGVTFAQALPMLLKAGESRLGRQTDHPEFTTVPLDRSRVDIGTPEVIDYTIPSASPNVGSDSFMPFRFGAKH